MSTKIKDANVNDPTDVTVRSADKNISTDPANDICDKNANGPNVTVQPSGTGSQEGDRNQYGQTRWNRPQYEPPRFSPYEVQQKLREVGQLLQKAGSLLQDLQIPVDEVHSWQRVGPGDGWSSRPYGEFESNSGRHPSGAPRWQPGLEEAFDLRDNRSFGRRGVSFERHECDRFEPDQSRRGFMMNDLGGPSRPYSGQLNRDGRGRPQRSQDAEWHERGWQWF